MRFSVNTQSFYDDEYEKNAIVVDLPGNDSNLLVVFYVQIMSNDFVM